MLCDMYKIAEQAQLTWILNQDGERRGCTVNNFEKGVYYWDTSKDVTQYPTPASNTEDEACGGPQTS